MCIFVKIRQKVRKVHVVTLERLYWVWRIFFILNSRYIFGLIFILPYFIRCLLYVLTSFFRNLTVVIKPNHLSSFLKKKKENAKKKKSNLLMWCQYHFFKLINISNFIFRFINSLFIEKLIYLNAIERVSCKKSKNNVK